MINKKTPEVNGVFLFRQESIYRLKQIILQNNTTFVASGALTLTSTPVTHKYQYILY